MFFVMVVCGCSNTAKKVTAFELFCIEGKQLWLGVSSSATGLDKDWLSSEDRVGEAFVIENGIATRYLPDTGILLEELDGFSQEQLIQWIENYWEKNDSASVFLSYEQRQSENEAEREVIVLPVWNFWIDEVLQPIRISSKEYIGFRGGSNYLIIENRFDSPIQIVLDDPEVLGL